MRLSKSPRRTAFNTSSGVALRRAGGLRDTRIDDVTDDDDMRDMLSNLLGTQERHGDVAERALVSFW